MKCPKCNTEMESYVASEDCKKCNRSYRHWELAKMFQEKLKQAEDKLEKIREKVKDYTDEEIKMYSPEERILLKIKQILDGKG